MEKKRVHYIDIAKGLLIMLVVLHHIPQLVTSKSVAMQNVDNLSILYVPFFMPAFFVLTGMCSNFSKPLVKFLRDKFCSILIPAFCLGFISMWINLICSGVTDIKEYCKLGFRTFIVYGGGYWFLTALFISSIIYWFVKNKISSIAIRFLILILCLIVGIGVQCFGIPNYWHVAHALVLVVFLNVGELFRKYDLNLKIGSVAFLLYIGLLIFVLMFNINIPYITAHMNIKFFEIPLFMLLSILGSIFIVAFSKLVGKNAIIEGLGKHSLVIYGLHISVLSAIMKVLAMYGADVGKIQTIGLIFIMALIICYFIALCINNTPLKVLIGKFNISK